MKKFTKSVALVVLTLFSLQFFAGCFGKFALINKVYDFNAGIGGKDLGGRFVRTVIFWAMLIIPVYEIAGLVDSIILNLVEFWTGSNPIAMKAGESETQYATIKGREFQMTATKGKLSIVELTGKNKGKETVLNFNADNSIMTYNNGKMIKIAEYKAEEATYASAQTGFVLASN